MLGGPFRARSGRTQCSKRGLENACQGLDTTTPAGKAMFQMMGVFAEFESSMIRERVRAASFP